MPNEGDVDNAYLKINGRKATAEEKKYYTNKDWSAGDSLYYGKVLVDYENLKQTYEKLVKEGSGDFEPVPYQVFKKKG